MPRLRNIRQLTERRIDVDEFDQPVTHLPACDSRCYDQKRSASGDFEVRVLAPESMLAELPAVISPEDDDRVVGDAQLLQFIEQPTNLCIDKADAGMVTT